MSLKRFQDWPLRLDRFLQAASERPFVWGEHDCALMACDWVREATGHDPARSFRGTYSSAAGAAMACKHLTDGGGLEQVAEKFAGELGQTEIPIALAQRGDLICAETERGPTLGVCIGRHAAVPGPDGLNRIPMTDCKRAWR